MRHCTGSLSQCLLANREFKNRGPYSNVLIRELRGPESTKLVRKFPMILDYAGRIHDKYFPDYGKWE